MSVARTLFIFTAGIAAGATVSYLLDPQGTTKRYKILKGEFEKTKSDLEKKISKKLAEYKEDYNQLVEKYAASGKDVIEKAKNATHLN